MAGRAARAALVASVTGLTLVLAACDIRLETDPLVTPTADAATAARDLAALQESAIVTAASVTSADDGSGEAFLLAVESSAAPLHLAILGGVYVPFPDATPAPDADARASDLRSAVMAARDEALERAFTDEDPEVAFLAGSRGFTHAFALWYAGALDAHQAGVIIPRLAERTLPGPWGEDVPLVPESTGVAAADIAGLAVMHDQARFTYEVIAARETGARRTLALEQARAHRERSDALAALAGIDERTAIYELPLALVAGEALRDVTARDTELALGWRYMELTEAVVRAQDRRWLMSAAFDAYAKAALTPSFTAANFPVLPGVDPATY